MEKCGEAENFSLTKKSPSLSDLSNSSMFECMVKSLPDNTLGDSASALNLQGQLEKAILELQSANHEIENLNSENYNLKTELNKCKEIIEMYKRVNFADSPFSKVSRKRRKRSKTNADELLSLNETLLDRSKDGNTHSNENNCVTNHGAIDYY